jgi:hypothetical protein
VVRALVVGAGAIGRGFLPWALEGERIDFFDSSLKLVAEMKDNGGFHTFMSSKGNLESLFVRPEIVTGNMSDLTLTDYDVAFVAVGPRNVGSVPAELASLECPIFSLENDPETVNVLSNALGGKDVYFGVPDVITSSTASEENLKLDRLSLHTEDGVLYLEDSSAVPDALRGNLKKVEWVRPDQLRVEWDAKLYLHNTPHCVAAYLGFLAGNEYVHEGFEDEFIKDAVSGVIQEMLAALKFSTSHNHEFMDSYAEKELRRFANPLLFDPILRVAREPLRKLQVDGRLTGALRLALTTGVEPYNLMLGISAALDYTEEKDRDFELMKRVTSFGVSNFLKYHLDIDTNSIESKYIARNFNAASGFIKRGLQ